jgi:hypothetical protein
MTSQRVVVALSCALLAVPATAGAQDGSGQPRTLATAEITPYAFLGSEGSGGVGAAVRWPLPARLSVEVETSYRRAALSAFNSNVSLLYDLPDIGLATPYVAAGIGLDQYVTADQAPAGQVVVQPRTALAVNAGGGVRVRADENWGIRADARWINGVGQRAPERWRLYNGVTFGRAGR